MDIKDIEEAIKDYPYWGFKALAFILKENPSFDAYKLLTQAGKEAEAIPYSTNYEADLKDFAKIKAQEIATEILKY